MRKDSLRTVLPPQRLAIAFPKHVGALGLCLPVLVFALFATLSACTLNVNGEGLRPVQDAGVTDSTVTETMVPEAVAPDLGIPDQSVEPEPQAETGPQDVVLDLDSTDLDSTIQEEPEAPVDVCVPPTCPSTGFECGVLDNPCGDPVECSCGLSQGCHLGECKSVIFVSTKSKPPYDGKSWATAFPDVQTAIDYALPNQVVWVAGGPYKAAPGTSAVATLKPFLRLHGHFAGNEISTSQRTLESDKNQTVLDGEGIYRVVVGAEGTTLDGFTIAHGKASDVGAGVVIAGVSNMEITHCRFESNVAGSGGGVGIVNATVWISDSVFSANSAGADGYGGGIFTQNAAVWVKNCELRKNHAGSGGGIGDISYSNLVVERTIFAENEGLFTGSGGGGVYNVQSTASFSNCLFLKNVATYAHGGGIHNYAATATITNCSFHGNVVGVYASKTGSASVYNTQGSTATITNSIVWGSGLPEVANYQYNDKAIVTFSDVNWGALMDGNINADPQFVGGDDLHLKKTSPCIDAANGDVAPETDFDGNQRQDVTTIVDEGTGTYTYEDIGAYEYQGN